jgi:glucose-6-phosphate 1-dehydrogenase
MNDSVIDFKTERVAGAPLSVERAPDSCALVIFGITGDLARRKLVPGLYNLEREGRLPAGVCLVGVGRRPLARDELLETLRESAAAFSRARPLEPAVWSALASRFEYVAGDFSSVEFHRALGRRLAELEANPATGGNRLFYLSTPSELFPVLLEGLHEGGLLPGGSGQPWTRVAIEKPFGRDLASACELNRLCQRVASESQLFRMDHYLGKESVQNLLVFRFGNPIFEPLWNRKYIDHVQITAAESIGIEGRGAFYEQTGVVRDMVQNHLMQVLALCAMEPPVTFAADDIRDRKLDLLRCIRPLDPGGVARDVVHGQYEGYLSEPGVGPASRTPTFVAMKLALDNWRWQGVPFYVRAGKGLAARVTEISVCFQSIPLCLFGRDDVCQVLQPNVLTMRLQPREGIQLRFMTKVPGEALEVSGVTMDFSYEQAFGQAGPEAYERLLLDCMRGDGTLFPRADATRKAWELVTPILEAHEAGPSLPLHTYAPGSQGPEAAAELIRRDGRAWRRLT